MYIVNCTAKYFLKKIIIKEGSLKLSLIFLGNSTGTVCHHFHLGFFKKQAPQFSLHFSIFQQSSIQILSREPICLAFLRSTKVAKVLSLSFTPQNFFYKTYVSFHALFNFSSFQIKLLNGKAKITLVFIATVEVRQREL